jgi:hypothetical protein
MPGRPVRRRQFRKDGQRQAMKTFYIHANKVVVSQSRGRVRLPEGAGKFGSERELAKLTAKWPAARLREVWNALPGTRPVSKFTDRKTAVHRIAGQTRRRDYRLRRGVWPGDTGNFSGRDRGAE